jgi:hypothetical protein
MPRGMMRLAVIFLPDINWAIALSLGCDRVIVVANGALDGLCLLQEAPRKAGGPVPPRHGAHGVMGLAARRMR